jgi:hypothetical protein
MRAILEGFAGVAPRSVVPNLIELLGTLLTRSSGSEVALDGGAPQWMKDILLLVSLRGFLSERKQIFILFLVRMTSIPAKQVQKIRQGSSKLVLGRFHS